MLLKFPRFKLSSFGDPVTEREHRLRWFPSRAECNGKQAIGLDPARDALFVTKLTSTALGRTTERITTPGNAPKQPSS